MKQVFYKILDCLRRFTLSLKIHFHVGLREGGLEEEQNKNGLSGDESERKNV